MVKCMENGIKPLITVIVPVYNGEQFIRRCLNSLVFQTLENIEIIAVSNGSTDATYEILQQYQQNYPSKVIVRQIEHTNGPGSGRNVGLSLARADYITFADADDYFEYDAMEQFYNKMCEGDYDIVYCANYDVRNGVMKKARTLPTTDKKYVEQHGSMVYWNKLFKKRLFEIAGKIPEDIVFEDIAYVSTLISISNKIGYIDKPLYYYILRDDSGVNDLKSDRILHELQANDIAIKNCDESVKQYLLASILYRVYYDMTKARWTYADKFIQWVKERRELFDINLILNDSKLSGILNYIDNIRTDCIPDIVYYNNFVPASEDYLENVNQVFREECRLVGLDFTNCDTEHNNLIREWKDKGEYDSLAAYYALKKIYETGGVYISPNVEVINTFNCFKYRESIWGFEDCSNFTDEVFGGVCGSNTIGDILRVIENGKCTNVSEAIKYVLVIEKKKNLNGNTQVDKDFVSLMNPTVFVTDIAGEKNVSRIRHEAMNNDYVTIKRSTIECIKNL